MDYQLIRADAYEVIDDYQADCLITDPPYEMTATGGGIGAKRQYVKDIKNSDIAKSRIDMVYQQINQSKSMEEFL